MIAPVDHIDQIMAVMQAAFDPAFGEAWNRRQIEDALLIGNCHYALIGANGDELEGDMPAAGFFLARRGYEEEELLLLAVHPAWRRGGLATRLLDRLVQSARCNGAQRLFLEMRRGNPAEKLYLGFGFGIIGQRPNYYRSGDGSRIDAITFTLALL